MALDRVGVVILGAITLALIAIAAFAVDWFRLGNLSVDLLMTRGCYDNECMAFSDLPGMFPKLAMLTFFESLGFALLVAIQTYNRAIGNAGNTTLARLSYTIAIFQVLLVVGTAYLFEPHAIDRSWGPLIMIAAAAAGALTNYVAIARALPAPIVPEARVHG